MSRIDASASDKRSRETPHARGEDTEAPHSVRIMIETPPRMWGRPDFFGHLLLCDGNTPTHVGKTRRNVSGKFPAWKHPHARGEDPTRLRVREAGSETPPRTWGRQIPSSWMRIGARNTPTHVGKTDHRSHRVSAMRKHPHARGEDTFSTGRF